MNQQLSAHVDFCFLIPEFGYAGNFWLHPRNAMTLLAGCRAMPEKRAEKVRCDECKMTIPILLSLQGPSGALCTTKAPIADEKVTREKCGKQHCCLIWILVKKQTTAKDRWEDKEVEFWSPVNELASNQIYLQPTFFHHTGWKLNRCES